MFNYLLSLIIGFGALFSPAQTLGASTFIVQQGGTGQSSFTSSQLLYGNGTNALSSVATGTIAYPTGLTGTANRYVVGGNLTIGLDTGYVIPLQTTLDAKADDTNTVTVSGTANQITSSAGAQNLSANPAFTLSIPSRFIFPNSFEATYGTTTYASSTALSASYASSTVANIYRLINHVIQADASDGLLVEAGNGTDVAILGAGNTANATFYGGVNVTGNLAVLTGSTLTVTDMTSALLQTNGSGVVAEYAGTSCTNQFVRSLSALGIATCATVANTDLANSTVSYGGVTLSLGGSDASPAFDLVDATNLPIVGGTTGTLTIARGGTGTTTTQAGRVYYGGGDGLSFQSVATTTVTCGGSITCSTFDILGSTPITISGSGGGLTEYDAWTHPEAGYSATTSGIGIGTSTSFAFLGVNPLAGISERQFVVGSSTNTAFVIDNAGNVGIGTSTPLFRMDLSGDTSANSAYYATRYSADTQPTGIVARKARGTILAPSAVLAGDYIALLAGRGYGATGFSASSDGAVDIQASETFTDAAHGTEIVFDTTLNGTVTRTEKMRLSNAGDLGIGTSTPKWRLTVASSTGPQLTLTDASLTSAPFNVRANGVYFTIGTSSPTTFATSSQFAFQLNGSTGSTTMQKFSVVGAATSTIVRGLTIESLAATRAVFSAADKGLVTSAASASLLNSLTDETGSGVAVFGTSPTFTTSIAGVPLISGGAAVGSTLILQGTSAASPTVATVTIRGASTLSPAMTFTTRGIGAGTTTPAYLLNLASSTAPQLALSDGSITAAPWVFRSGNGNFYLATGSPTTFATTSNATLNNPFSIIAGGISGLFGFASSTPWANVGITNTAGIPAFAIGSTTGTSFLIDSLGRTAIGSSSPWSRFTLANGNLGIASSSITVAQYNPATSTSQSVDCRDSNTIFVSLGTGATTITLAPMVGGQSCVVALQNPNATAGAVTWSTTASQKLFWPSGGTTPTQTTTANKVDLWSFKAIAYPTSATSTPGTIIMGAQTPNFGP